MPANYAESYFPVLLQAVIAAGLAAFLIGASALLGQRVKNRVKDMPYEYEIDLGYTGTAFRAGHLIRLDLSSSNFPHLARNESNNKTSTHGFGSTVCQASANGRARGWR